MKNGFYYLLSYLFFFSWNPLLGAELKGIKFYQEGEVSFLKMVFDRPDILAKRFMIPEDKQIIIDLKNVDARGKVIRSFDTSEFAGSVVFVSAYKKPKTVNDLRLAIQLRENVRSILYRDGKSVVLKIENRFGVFSQDEIEQKYSFKEKAKVVSSDKVLVPKSDSIEDILENLTLSGRKKYVGKKISFNVKDVNVEDLLKMIADASGFNIIITEDIKKLSPLTLNLTNIPWDQALDTILNLNKLVAKKNGIILLVTTLSKATKDKKLEIDAKKVAKKEARLVAKIFPISYAKTTDLNKIIKEYLTPKRGSVSDDKRTNSIIVKDIPEVIEKIRKIIEVLDTQTPQVLIESKIIEVTESYAKEIGLREGLGFGYDPVGSGSEKGPGFSFSTAPDAADRTQLFGLQIARFGRLTDLKFRLQLMESESKLKIISSPKVITQNKKKARINTKDSRYFAKTESSGGTTTTTFDEATAELILEVTPQVTNEGSIVMDINLKKEQFGAREFVQAPPTKQTRDIKTSVLVDNGSTIVLGGIYSFTKRENHSGIPFLKDLPLLGWLFRSIYNPQTEKNEMIIFLTPRVVNQEEAGLIGRS
jgi:type IV pilus assembly protein PilQ